MVGVGFTAKLTLSMRSPTWRFKGKFLSEGVESQRWKQGGTGTFPLQEAESTLARTQGPRRDWSQLGQRREGLRILGPCGHFSIHHGMSPGGTEGAGIGRTREGLLFLWQREAGFGLK